MFLSSQYQSQIKICHTPNDMILRSVSGAIFIVLNQQSHKEDLPSNQILLFHKKTSTSGLFQHAIKMMIVKLAIVLTSTFAQLATGSTSAKLARIAQDTKAGGDEERRTNHSRQAKKVGPVETIALRDGDMVNEGGESPNSILGLRALRGENDSRNWNHGTSKTPANRRDRMEICAPSATRDGDTLFAFLR